MNYEQALAYIHSISWTFTKPGLERIGELCRRLGDPQKHLKFVHVAGTNGKGSFCSMLDSVLRHASYKVGLFTSPYIRDFCERIRVDGENIPKQDLAQIVAYVQPIADAMEDKPTEFELITAIGLEYFKRCACDVVVLEAGMGGRLDSTNIIESALLSVITGISLDHTAYLGDTVEKIAAEKAGIIKEGGSVLYCGNDARVRAVIKEKADQMHATLLDADKSTLTLSRCDLSGCTFDLGAWKNVELSLLGLYQPENAANVLYAVEALRKQGMEIPEDAVYAGLAAARWQARFEKIVQDPLVIFDGAHNPEGIDAAVQSVKYYFGTKKVAVLTGVMRDKDYEYVATRLSEIADRAFCIKPDNPRALDAQEYARVLERRGVQASAHDSVQEAFARAKAFAKESGSVLVCLGSLYMYEQIYALI
ncbi:MAG: bifunctional folylpolyglutamate synthase/dihydrofolate synthase [Clostridia bacterium]|nr:bifunctional folylpolyglutamate synthase/dihydrofolate synthase [Clostridia bacterium]MBQ5792694.1 bifunctional folylpolyglutamate synthase/dihydrofolate synthase [Clostridia bacterium]